MNIAAHEEFAKDQIKFWSDYSEVSDRVAARFQQQVDETDVCHNRPPFGGGAFLPHGETASEALETAKF